MSVAILLAALRKFWLLLAFGGLLGGGLGVAAATFLGATATLYEAKIESVILSGDEAEVLGSEFFRATSVSTEIIWFFPGESESFRAVTVGALLMLDASLEQLADTMGVSSTELKVRVALGEADSQNLLVVRVFGASEEQSQQLAVAVAGAVLEVNEDFYPGLPAPILRVSSSATPTLSEQSASGELLAWRKSVVADILTHTPNRFLWEPESLLSAANEAYLATVASESEDVLEASDNLVDVTFSVKSPNRIVAHIQSASSEEVAAELDVVVGALEGAVELLESFEKSSAVVVVDIEAPVAGVLGSPSVDRAPVIVASGALLGVSLAGLFALVSLSQRRILWSPTQMFAVAKAPPIAVVSRRKSDRPNTVIAPENPGIVTLRTNLFHGDGGSRRVAFTSPASNFDQGAVATVLAESLARLGGRVAVLDTGAGEPFYSLPESASIKRESSGSSPHGRPSVLSIEHPASDTFDLLTLGPHVRGSSDFYLSSDWQVALSWLDQNYDYRLVILNSVLAGLGAAEAAIGSGRVIVTIRPGETRPQDLAAALIQLAQSGSPAPEIVVVGVPPDDVGYWYLSTPTLGE